MQEDNYDELFEILRKDKYDILIKNYFEFESNYKNPIKAVEDFTKKAKKEELALTEIEVNGTLYFDDFKKDIESKMNFSHERFINPISYTINTFLPEIFKVVFCKNQFTDFYKHDSMPVFYKTDFWYIVL